MNTSTLNLRSSSRNVLFMHTGVHITQIHSYDIYITYKAQSHIIATNNININYSVNNEECLFWGILYNLNSTIKFNKYIIEGLYCIIKKRYIF